MVNNKSVLRKKLQKRLIKDRPELLWSYDKSQIKSLSDTIIVSKLLAYGSKNDWNDLKDAYPKSVIKRIWENEYLLGGFQMERQEKLVVFFFNSKNPARYIADKRRRKLNQHLERSF